MSGYHHGRRAPNVAQYLRELQTINPTQDLMPSTPQEDELDLSMFTNTSFLDVDSGLNTDFQSHPSKPDSESTRPDNPTSATSTIDDYNSLDFMNGDFNFPDFGQPYASPTTLQGFPDSLNSHLQPIQPSPQSVYPVPPQQQQQQAQQNGFRHHPPRLVTDHKAVRAGPVSGSSPSGSTPTTNGGRGLSFEEQTRIAAEEDKRRRNTAASARFRVKKKQREQALEKSAKEMNEKVSTLELRIAQLETENKWLKNLIMEKNDGNSEDMSKLWKEWNAKEKAGGAGGEADEKAAKKKKPAPASPEEHEGGDMTG